MAVPPAAMGQARPALPPGFDPAYVENAVQGFLHTNLFAGERPFVPMIDENFTKQGAIPYDLWGLLYDGWAPDPDLGTSVFLTGLDKRGPDNRRKRIYISALTPDLYRPMYAGKVAQFLDKLFDRANEGKPLMRRYLDHYFDLFWDLHLGVRPDEIPPEVRQIGESFNTVIAYRDPTQPVVYENYMKVRRLRGPLMSWVSAKIEDVMNGRVRDPQKTFVYYWSKNGGGGEDFRYRDVVFECFHNFGALSQWGGMLYAIVLMLGTSTGDASAKAWFRKTMESDFQDADGAAFTPLERYTMELFRVISLNGGSISSLQQLGLRQPDRHGYAITPHKAASFDPRHWKNPAEFDPSRYESTPASNQLDGAQVEATSASPNARSRRRRLREGRPQRRDRQQRLRHGVRRRRRQGVPRLRLCGLCAVRLRLPALPRRTSHHRGVRRSLEEGLGGEDRVRQARHREPGKSLRRHNRSGRRHHRLPQGLGASAFGYLPERPSGRIRDRKKECGMFCDPG